LKLFIKNKLKTFWSFSQKGSIWRFIFGDDKYIIGETRDITNKKLYLFTLDYTSGKKHLNNFPFEKDNYWVSLEGATQNIFFLGRFEKPELPYQKNIIALDIETGKKLWENEKYSYLFNTEDILFGINRKFECNEIAEINLKTGEVLRIIPEYEHINLYELRNMNEDYLFENSNYPIVYKNDETNKIISDIFRKICFERCETESIEYIQKGSLVIFNYYIKLGNDSNTTGKVFYENRFVIYNINKSEIIFEDTLNKTANYCVPDSFFIKKDFLLYLKEKNELNCIKLNLI
jgi:hypothetical protein